MRITLAVVCAFWINILGAQVDFNMDLVAHIPNDEPLSDVWGWVDEDGTEYAIIGARTHTEIYSLKNPSDPELVFEAPGVNSVWRDIKTLDDYIYVTADEGADGVVIIDMTEAPENITFTKVNPVVNGSQVLKCHNLYIDDKSEIMFLAGCNDNGGVLAFDITTDPMNPQLIQVISQDYAHDVFVRDNLAFASEIGDGEFTIHNIEDINNPVALGSAPTTNLFTHNAWSNEANDYVYTTDERPNGTIDAFDISDVNNPVKVDVFVPESIRNQGIIPHNTHWHNNFLITSWYDYGVVISDVSNPAKIIEVGHYNTGEAPDCWGAYPYLPSGLVLASDIRNGFFVLEPSYERAAYVDGKVVDASSGNAIFNASIEINTDDPLADRADPKGNFAVGGLQEGTFLMTIEHPEYIPETVEVTLEKGKTLTVEVSMNKEERFTQTVKVIEKETGSPLEGVDVLFTKDIISVDERTNESGEVTSNLVAGDFQVVAAKWGFTYGVLEATFSENGEYIIEIERGYEDDFIFDNDWITSSDDPKYEWTRAIPIGTYFGSQESNPSADVDDDFGDYCFVTGNGPGSTGALDIDNGITTLTSPIMELADYPEAILSFRPWFFNDGGSGGNPNDSYRIFATNGAETELLTEISETTGGWEDALSFRLSDFISLNNEVRIIFEASDDANNHLVEAGLDEFRVNLGGNTSSVGESSGSENWSIFPNPASTFFSLRNDLFRGTANVAIFNSSGSLVSKYRINDSVTQLAAPSEAGIYILRIISDEGELTTKSLAIIKPN